jgi:hypothetical protein
MFGVAAACAPEPNAATSDAVVAPYDSAATARAVDVATQRLREHGQAGLSLDDVKRTQDWFTPELYQLLVNDMSFDPGGVGYLNRDPFTDAQDDVGPFRFENVRYADDTVMVRFSREGYEHKRDSVTLAMRRIEGSWRIANFIYSAHPPCHRDLAAGLARHAKEIAEKRPINDGTCSD